MVTGITLTPSSGTLVAIGGTLTLSATVTTNQGVSTTTPIAWTSSNPSVVSVAANAQSAIATAVSAGSSIVTASAGGQSATANITVSLAPPAVSALVVSPATLTILSGQSAPMVAVVRDAAGNTLTGRTISWRSGDTTIASVSAQGVVTARTFGGPVGIIATSEGISDTALVTVQSPFITAVDIAVGERTACAIEDGGIWCWGDNASGQRATGTFVNNRVTTRVSSTERFVDIDGGAMHFCGQSSTNALWCWGFNGNGRLGDGTTTNRPELTRVTGNLAVSAFAAGDASSCGLPPGGALLCWGNSFLGGLGTGTNQSVNATPQVVAGGVSFSQIASSKSIESRCGLTASGQAWCWGNNSGAMLGDSGRVATITTPTRIIGNRLFKQIALGISHTCALALDGQAICFGNNRYGQIGTDTMFNAQQRIPVPVSGSLRFTDIAAGAVHNCAVATDGVLYCWGENQYGQLGDGTLTNRSVPTPVDIDVRFTRVSAANTNTCAIAVSTIVYCWGQNIQGAAGNGGTAIVRSPSAVPRPQ